jgi:hypothetical protein
MLFLSLLLNGRQGPAQAPDFRLLSRLSYLVEPEESGACVSEWARTGGGHDYKKLCSVRLGFSGDLCMVEFEYSEGVSEAQKRRIYSATSDVLASYPGSKVRTADVAIVVENSRPSSF